MKCSISIYRNDTLPAFGAYLRKDGPPDDNPMMHVNVEAIFDELIDEDGNDVLVSADDRKRIIIETMMHEFGHVVEHFLGLEPNEELIESAVSSWGPNNI